MNNGDADRKGAAWRRARGAVLAEEPRCRNCTRPATQVDHIVPVDLGGTDERSNLQALCTYHHRAKTALEQSKARASGQPFTEQALKERALYRTIERKLIDAHWRCEIEGNDKDCGRRATAVCASAARTGELLQVLESGNLGDFYAALQEGDPLVTVCTRHVTLFDDPLWVTGTTPPLPVLAGRARSVRFRVPNL